ncbi:MAG: hypothetical protein AABY22_17860 [Nanoarchaeota archaeon]
MKTAKEWVKELNLFRAYATIHNDYIINKIKQIQLEAWEKGIKKNL